MKQLIKTLRDALVLANNWYSTWGSLKRQELDQTERLVHIRQEELAERRKEVAWREEEHNLYMQEAAAAIARAAETEIERRKGDQSA